MSAYTADCARRICQGVNVDGVCERDGSIFVARRCSTEGASRVLKELIVDTSFDGMLDIRVTSEACVECLADLLHVDTSLQILCVIVCNQYLSDACLSRLINSIQNNSALQEVYISVECDARWEMWTLIQLVRVLQDHKTLHLMYIPSMVLDNVPQYVLDAIVLNRCAEEIIISTLNPHKHNDRYFAQLFDSLAINQCATKLCLSLDIPCTESAIRHILTTNTNLCEINCSYEKFLHKCYDVGLEWDDALDNNITIQTMYIGCQLITRHPDRVASWYTPQIGQAIARCRICTRLFRDICIDLN